MALDKKLQDAQIYGKQLNLTFEQIAVIQQNITNGLIKTTAQMKKAAAEAQKFQMNLDAAQDVISSTQDLAAGLQKPFEKILNVTQQQLSNEIDIAKAMKKQIPELVKAGALQKGMGKEIAAGLDSTIKMNKAIQNIAKNKGLVSAMKAGSDAANNVQSSVDNIFANIPGGGAIADMFGFDTIGDQIKDKMLQGLISTNAAGTTSIGIFGALKATVMAISQTLMANPLLLMISGAVALVALLGTALGTATKFNKKAIETAAATGTTVMATKQLAIEAHKVSVESGLQLANSEDILNIQNKLSKTMGSSYMLSAQMSGEIAETAKAFGFGVDAAADFTANIMQAGAGSEEASEMLRSVGAELLGTGLNAGAVIEDIAKNAKLTGKYFKGSVKELKKAAVQAAKMGVTLDDMASASDALLDIEGSLTAQFEYQALTGRQMNLDKAKQLMFEGKTAEATKEILSQTGSLADLQSMGPVQAALLEKATGMSVDTLIRAKTIQQMGPKIAEEEIKLLESQGMTLDQIAKMDDKQRQAALADANTQQKMQKSIGDMRAKLMKALLPIGESLLTAFEAMAPALSLAGDAISVMLKPIKAVASVVAEVMKFLEENKGIALAIGGIVAAEFALRKKAVVTENAMKIAKGANLAYTTTMNVLTGKINLKEKLSVGYETAKKTLMKSQLVQLVAITAQKVYQGTLGVAELARQTAIKAMLLGQQVIQATINTLKMVSNVISLGAIGPLLAGAGAAIAAAIPSIFTGFGMIPFGLGIPLAFAAVAGLVALIASMSKGDDVLSSPTGGGGYGSRVLFGPEGAISFNNKDTIVAGTDLGYKMNDGVIAPPGAIKVDDYAEGEPAEANVVNLSNDAAKKLGYAVQMGQQGLLGAMFGGGSGEPPPTKLAGESITALVAAQKIVPSPVLIMNPVIPVLETNPILIGAAMMDMMGGFLGGLFGGGKDKDPNAEMLAKLDEVIAAVQNIRIDMDGEKVGVLTRVANSFRSKTRSGV